jgi:hypothetical protein
MGHTPFESGQGRGMLSARAGVASWRLYFLSSVSEKRGVPAHTAAKKRILNFRFMPRLARSQVALRFSVAMPAGINFQTKGVN